MRGERSWGGTRAGAGNPFAGRKHTAEWKAAQSARQFTWTAEDLTTLRRWYLERQNAPLKLGDLAALLGRPKTSVSRMARQLGLANHARKTGRKPTAKHPTLEAARAAIGAAARERIAKNGHPRGMLGKRQSPEFCQRQSEMRTGKPLNLSEEQRQALSDRSSRMMAERPVENAYSRTKYGRREDLEGRFFRSSWEANYARYLNFLLERGMIAGWEYEAETFWFEAIRRGVRSYKPDFKVTEKNGHVHYVEIKGWMDAKSKTKIARMARYHPAVDLRVVDEKAYREIERLVGRGLPGWERRVS